MKINPDMKFSLYSNTFIWKKGWDVLLYNSDNGESLKFDASTSPDVDAFFNNLNQIENMYSIIVPQECSSTLTELLKIAINRGLGYLSSDEEIVISLPPIANVQQNVDWILNVAEATNTLPYLSHIVVFIGGNCEKNDYYRQIIFPFRSEERLGLERINYFISHNDLQYIDIIDIVLSDISEDIYSLLNAFAPIKNKVRINMRYPLLSNIENLIKWILEKGFKLRLICLQSDNIRVIDKQLSYYLVFRDESDFQHWGKLIKDDSIKIDSIALYDNNRSFFKQHVNITTEEILAMKPSKRIIHMHQFININNWGKLYILPDGKVYSDICKPALGTMSDSLMFLIGQELKLNYAWRKIRNKGKCNACVFQFMCPSPSVIEDETIGYKICD